MVIFRGGVFVYIPYWLKTFPYKPDFNGDIHKQQRK